MTVTETIKGYSEGEMSTMDAEVKGVDAPQR